MNMHTDKQNSNNHNIPASFQKNPNLSEDEWLDLMIELAKITSISMDLLLPLTRNATREDFSEFIHHAKKRNEITATVDTCSTLRQCTEFDKQLAHLKWVRDIHADGFIFHFNGGDMSDLNDYSIRRSDDTHSDNTEMLISVALSRKLYGSIVSIKTNAQFDPKSYITHTDRLGYIHMVHVKDQESVSLLVTEPEKMAWEMVLNISVAEKLS